MNKDALKAALQDAFGPNVVVGDVLTMNIGRDGISVERDSNTPCNCLSCKYNNFIEKNKANLTLDQAMELEQSFEDASDLLDVVISQASAAVVMTDEANARFERSIALAEKIGLPVLAEGMRHEFEHAKLMKSYHPRLLAEKSGPKSQAEGTMPQSEATPAAEPASAE